jgi:hypothetical protein
MTSINIDYFDLLSNELVAGIVNYLDLVSLYRLASVSHRLQAFKQISNEQWRQYYAQRWFAEDKELAIYELNNWQSLYYQRVQIERDYLIWFGTTTTSSTVSGQDQAQDRNDEPDEHTRPKINQFDHNEDSGVSLTANSDPCRILLSSNFQPAPLLLKNCCITIDQSLNEESVKNDAKKNVFSSRFEIVVTAIAKCATQDINALKNLEFIKGFLSVANLHVEEYKEHLKRPFGLLGLLAKYLDLTTPPDVLPIIVNILWIIASGEYGINEDFFVGLDLVPKLVNIVTKAADAELKHACLSVLTWFNPEKPENQQALVNPSFMKILLDRLEEEHRTIGEDLQWLLRLISIGAIFNLSVIKQHRTATRLMQLSREYADDPMRVSHLFGAVRDLCIDSDEFSLEVLQDDTAVDYVMSCVKVSKDRNIRKAAKRAVGLLDVLVETEAGAEQLFERDAVKFLLPFMEDPTNTHLFGDIYGTLRTLIRYANDNGFGEEIFAQLLEHKEALLDRGYESGLAKMREDCDNFWMTFSCATAPPRDVSTKLVDRALPSILNETKLNIKKDAGLLLANLAEIDLEAFAGKDLTEVFNYMIEYFINFDAAKELAELVRLEQEQDGKKPTLNIVAENEAEEEVTEQGEEDEENEENEEDEEEEDEENEFSGSPWPLNLLAQIIRVDNLKPLAIQNERLMNKLFSLCDDDSYDFETHFLVMYYFSHLVQVPGWDSSTALKYMEEFAIEANYDVEWNFAFAKIEPYAHLLRKDNPTPMVIFGSWFLAHMSTTEPGRQILQKELAPEVLKWMKVYPHPRVEYNMDHFAKNMKKKARRNK